MTRPFVSPRLTKSQTIECRQMNLSTKHCKNHFQLAMRPPTRRRNWKRAPMNIPNSFPSIECPNCGEQARVQTHSGQPVVSAIEAKQCVTLHCPNCGRVVRELEIHASGPLELIECAIGCNFFLPERNPALTMVSIVRARRAVRHRDGPSCIISSDTTNLTTNSPTCALNMYQKNSV